MSLPNDPVILAASLFSRGEHLASGAGVVTIVLFVVLGRKSRNLPAGGAARGRIEAARLLRWVCLTLAVVGLIIMLIAST
jgi:hypothetical protein